MKQTIALVATILNAVTALRPATVNAAPELGTKPVALTTVISGIGKDGLRLIASIALEMPEVTVFMACTTDMVTVFKTMDLPLKKDNLRLVPVLDKYKGLSRYDLTEKGWWIEFNEKRIDILKLALEEGHNGAWYVDGDTFLLAPLPHVDAPIGLTRAGLDPGIEGTFGEWNSGTVFFRSFEALDTWKRAGQALDQASAIHQISLREVAKKHASEFEQFGCGVNVGSFRMDPLISVGFKPYFDQVKCVDGVVQYKGCPIILGHWHVEDTNGLKVRPYMELALRECNHPLLAAWLESY